MTNLAFNMILHHLDIFIVYYYNALQWSFEHFDIYGREESRV